MKFHRSRRSGREVEERGEPWREVRAAEQRGVPPGHGRGYGEDGGDPLPPRGEHEEPEDRRDGVLVHHGEGGGGEHPGDARYGPRRVLHGWEHGDDDEGDGDGPGDDGVEPGHAGGTLGRPGTEWEGVWVGWVGDPQVGGPQEDVQEHDPPPVPGEPPCDPLEHEGVLPGPEVDVAHAPERVLGQAREDEPEGVVEVVVPEVQRCDEAGQGGLQDDVGQVHPLVPLREDLHGLEDGDRHGVVDGAAQQEGHQHGGGHVEEAGPTLLLQLEEGAEVEEAAEVEEPCHRAPPQPDLRGWGGVVVVPLAVKEPRDDEEHGDGVDGEALEAPEDGVGVVGQVPWRGELQRDVEGGDD
eukprot:764230-Hanusia_phi.AAC.2